MTTTKWIPDQARNDMTKNKVFRDIAKGMFYADF